MTQGATHGFLAALRRRTATIAALVLTIVVGALVAASVSTSTMVSVSARSEIVEVGVTQPDAMAFILRGVRVIPSLECAQGILVRPGQGAVVRYQQTASGGLAISVDGDHVLEFEAGGAGGSATGDEPGIFLLEPEDAECAPPSVTRLPVNGLLDLGAEPANVADFDYDPALLLSGDIRTHGRAISSIGPVPLSFPPFTPNALFLADSSPLLAGSRLANAVDSQGRPARWWGFADFEIGERGLRVEAATNATEVDLIAATPALGPGGGTSAGGVDRISLTAGSRVAFDPNLRWLAFFAAILVFLLGLFRRDTDA